MLHLLMLHNLNIMTFSSINGVFWSLALESQLYVLFPFLVWLASRKGIRAALGATFVVCVAWQSLVYRNLGFSLAYVGPFPLWYDALPGRCFELVAGMAAAALVARPLPRQERWAALIGLLLVGPAGWFVLDVSRFGPLSDQAWGVIFACAIVLLARVPDHIFERRGLSAALVWVGTISYSVYLIHYPIIHWVTPGMLHLPQNGAAAMAFDVGRVGLILALGYAFHLAFERPFMGAKKFGWKLRLTASPTA